MALSPILFKLPISLILVLAGQAYASLPYTPTRILATPQGSDNIIYILDPPSPASPKGKLRRLSLNSSFRQTSIPAETLSPSLPFLGDNADASFTSVITHNGSISVYAGDCSLGGRGSSVWEFLPNGRRGAWVRRSYNVGDMGQTTPGPNWLASGISFSSNVAAPDNFFIFGGMCPSSETTASGTWTSDATYSNQLLVFQSQPESDDFDFKLVSGNGQPTPEAGFTITPLTPTHSVSADGTRTQQQDFVLVGGNTQTAFINMNMIALFSLPQSSWTFLPVEIPTAKTDLLSKRHAPYVDSRSGHTSVLTADGQRIIVFGGWVGDVSTPAEPPLTILEVGAGYGGSGSWKWSNSHATPFEDGESLYGHGAVILPGNVMLVTGGFSISRGSNSLVKRASQVHNTKNLFLNVTSGEWINSYNVGKAPFAHGKQSNYSGPLDSNNEKAGLIAGLLLGLLAVGCIVFFFICYRKRIKKQREELEQENQQIDEQEKAANRLSTGESHPQGLLPHLGMTSIDGRGGSVHATSIWDARRGQQSQVNPFAHGVASSGVREAQRSGVDLNIPSPQRGLRNTIARRPVAYHSTPRYDDRGYHWTSGDMHAIEEKDEESSSTETSRQPSVAHTRPSVAMVNDRNNVDPFRDPDPEPDADHSHGVIRRTTSQISRPPLQSLSAAEERQREMSGWVRDWAAVDAVSRNNTTSTNAGLYSPTKSGRSSPSKSDRTESNLSDRSSRSNYSMLSASNTALSRNISAASGIRSYLPSILPAIISNPWASSAPAPTNEGAFGNGNMQSMMTGEANNASRPGTASGSGGDHTTERTDSFTTAKSENSGGNQENEALLGLQPDTEPTFTRKNTNARSPVRTARPSLIGGWVGSVRRGVGKAITATVTGRSTSLTDEAMRSRGVIGSDGYYEYTPTSSPAKSEHGERQPATPSQEKASFLANVDDTEDNSGVAMQRSVSDGEAFWMAKRGAKDWDVDDGPVSQLCLTKTRPDSQQTIVPAPRSQPQHVSNPDMGWRTEGAWRSGVSNAAVSTPSARASSLEVRARQTSRVTSTGTQQNATSDAASDWDVEAAVEQRVVQVMFTVPREKLRVVNADIDVASLVSTLREDEDWMEGNRDPGGERIWAIAEDKTREELGDAAEEGR